MRRWDRVKAVFLEALERQGDDRRNYVAAACADDPSLQREVESLLASDEAAASFCETPAAAMLGPEAFATTERRLTAGDRIGAYVVEGFLGAGGMGEVYRARDTRLGRAVAIKTLSAELDDPASRRRLLREAQHASILNHPNICTIHEVVEEENLPFIVMEYVDGRSLHQIIRERQGSIDQALAWGIQIADALDHAHQRGIVHRDLKSSNVIVDGDGRAMVLDFGVARRVADAENPQSTETTGTHQGLAGTLSYMAPELLLGKRADARSDVWSIGVLLYEMVIGNLPFVGRTSFETSSAIIGEAPRPMPHCIPLAVRLVIDRCLAKDPAMRYGQAAEVRAALEAIRARRTWPLVGRLLISGGRSVMRNAAVFTLLAVVALAGVYRARSTWLRPTVDRIATIAVLPLEDTSGDGAGYYADGVTDALIAQLGSLSDVRVISRISAARAAKTVGAAADIGRVLSADALVQGTVHRAADRITIDVRLVDTARGAVLWSDSFERSSREVLVLQADVVRALTVGVRLSLRPEARDRLSAVRAVRPDVYEEYLKGRYEWNQRTERSLKNAIEHFTRASALDPTYAPAHAGLADCYNQLGTVMVGTGSPREFRPRAAAAAIRALQIDPYSAEAHAALGYVRHYEWQWKDAEREFLRAIELNPSYALARIWYANMLMSKLRFDEALRQVYAARDLDPFSLIINTNVAWVLHNAGRPAEAVEQLKRTVELDPDYPQARWRLAGALAAVGRHDQALQEANRFVALTNRSPSSLTLLAHIHALGGRRREAAALLDELVERSRHEYVPPGTIGPVYALLGRSDEALAWMEKAYEEGSNATAYLAVDDSKSLRGDPRFEALLRRVGLE